MTDKTPFDLLSETHTLLLSLHQKVDLLNKNLNLLNSKANGQILSALSTNSDIKTIIVDDNSIQSEQAPEKPRMSKETHVFGTFYNTNSKPVVSAMIKIMDSSNHPILSLRTDHQGKWSTKLKPGKYSLKYISDKAPTTYRIIDIKDGQEELEVL